jgi:CBS domain-containing protein
MERLGPDDVLHEDDDASTALGKMIGGAGRFPVLNGNRLVGIVSRRDIMKMLEFKSGLQR